MSGEHVLSVFEAEVGPARPEPRLDYAALLIAAAEYPDLDVGAQLVRLDELGAAVAEGAGPSASAGVRATAVIEQLFRRLGFRGNAEDYYDPRNSYLNDVLDRRIGIPISLAVLFIEVARRAGLVVAGVGYPRHFLVKYHDGEREWLVDCFHAGTRSSVAEFRAEALRLATAPDHVLDYYLAAVTPRQILTRLLTNLKLIYLQRRDDARALRTQDFLLALNPWSFPDIRDRGALRGRIGDHAGARSDLETYLAHQSDAEDAPAVRRLLDELRA